MKQCWKCLKSLPIIYFHKDKSKKDGLCGRCKGCEKFRKRKSGNRKSNIAYNRSPIGKFKSYKRGAMARSISFNLSFYDFLIFWNKPCFYCGDQIDTVGLDRKNSDIGYELNNIVSCCKTCNFMKGKKEYDKFMQLVRRIAERHNT